MKSAISSSIVPVRVFPGLSAPAPRSSVPLSKLSSSGRVKTWSQYSCGSPLHPHPWVLFSPCPQAHLRMPPLLCFCEFHHLLFQVSGSSGENNLQAAGGARHELQRIVGREAWSSSLRLRSRRQFLRPGQRQELNDNKRRLYLTWAATMEKRELPGKCDKEKELWLPTCGEFWRFPVDFPLSRREGALRLRVALKPRLGCEG